MRQGGNQNIFQQMGARPGKLDFQWKFENVENYLGM